MPYVKIDDGELFYEESGAGPAVVLVHGSSGNSDHWHQQVPAFVQAGFRVVRFDLRGFGRSRVLHGREAKGTIAEDIEQVRMALQLGRIFVVGQANGAEGALEYALDYSQNTRGIVVATTFRGADGEPAFVELRDRLAPSNRGSRPRVELQLGATYRATNPEGVRRFLEIAASNPRGEPAGPDQVQQRRVPSDYARLAQMKVPTLVIAAEEDILTPPALMRELADHIPGASYAVVAKAGRYSFWEQPEAYNQAVLAFLRERTEKTAGRGAASGKLASIPGAQIYYEEAGTSYRTVVFVHALDGDSDSWARQIPAFVSAGYRCIRYDIRDTGRSRSTRDFAGPASLAEDLGQLAQALDLGSFFVVGAAGGGIGAVDFTFSHPDRVRGVIVASSAGSRDLDAGVASRLRQLKSPVLFLAADNDTAAPPSLVFRAASQIPDASVVTLPDAGRLAHWETPAAWNRAAIEFLDGLA